MGARKKAHTKLKNGPEKPNLSSEDPSKGQSLSKRPFRLRTCCSSGICECLPVVVIHSFSQSLRCCLLPALVQADFLSHDSSASHTAAGGAQEEGTLADLSKEAPLHEDLGLFTRRSSRGTRPPKVFVAEDSCQANRRNGLRAEPKKSVGQENMAVVPKGAKTVKSPAKKRGRTAESISVSDTITAEDDDSEYSDTVARGPKARKTAKKAVKSKVRLAPFDSTLLYTVYKSLPTALLFIARCFLLRWQPVSFTDLSHHDTSSKRACGEFLSET